MKYKNTKIFMRIAGPALAALVGLGVASESHSEEPPKTDTNLHPQTVQQYKAGIAISCLKDWQSAACMAATTDMAHVLSDNYREKLPERNAEQIGEECEKLKETGNSPKPQKFGTDLRECFDTIQIQREETGISPNRHLTKLLATVYFNFHDTLPGKKYKRDLMDSTGISPLLEMPDKKPAADIQESSNSPN